MANKGHRKRKETLRKKIISHHLRYEYNGLTHKQEERTVNIFSNEHYITRLLQTRGKYVSKGFLFVLIDFIFDRLLTGNFVDLPAKQANITEEKSKCMCYHEPGSIIPTENIENPICPKCHKPLL